MSGIRRRLEKLEANRLAPEDEAERQKRLKVVREAAEQENERFFRYLGRDGDFISYPGDEPPFEITEEGVFCTRDGKPVTTYRQTHAEVLYWQEVEWGGPGLVHDEESQAFFTPDGEVAVSRTHFDLRLLLGKPREEWIRRELEGEGV